MLTIKENVLGVENEIKNSKFLSYIYNVSSEQMTTQYIDHIKQTHPKATHICYGYVIDNAQERFDDDGEPSFTAGKPIIDTIKKQNLSNVLAVVVRYYGGIKLGAGGLVRAYTLATTSALKLAQKVELNLYRMFEVKMVYEVYDKFKAAIEKLGIKVTATTFLEQVEVQVAVADKVIIDFIDLTASYKVSVKDTQKIYYM